MPRYNMLPTGPLVRLVEREAKARERSTDSNHYSQVRDLFKNEALRTSYQRAKARGTITDTLADRIAIEILGLHPFYIYGDVWWKGVPND